MFGPDLEWDVAILELIHDAIIEKSGGATGYHDKRLVESALARPQHTAFGREQYRTPYAKAAALLDAIANNHGFRDGNKRTAMAAASLYLHLNNIEADFTNQEYEDFMLHVVNDKPKILEISRWLKEHSNEQPPSQS
jgi:death-on-curing protein